MDTLLITLYEAFEPVCAGKSIALELEMGEESYPDLYTDPERLFQILSIYMDNAVSYSSPKQLIRIRTKVTAKFLTFFIEDHGRGISLKDKALSMEKYSSEMNARIFKYMIVSLAIVAIVLIGTVGILLVILNQRKKSMAVAYCCGATPWKSFLELYGEISSVFLAGGILGLALSGGITPRLSAVESAADFYPVNIVFVILFCLAAALLCCGAALAGVDNKDPVKNLKEL